MNTKKIKVWILIGGIVSLYLFGIFSNLAAQEGYDLQVFASIRDVKWNYSSDFTPIPTEDLEQYPEGYIFGYNTCLSFSYKAIFRNAGDTPLNITGKVLWDFPADLAPHMVYGGFILEYVHTCQCSPCGSYAVSQNETLILEPGRNTFRCHIRVNFYDFQLGNQTRTDRYPPTGKYTFWILSENSSMEYDRETVNFSSSHGINFLLHDYEYIILSLIVCAVVFLASWFSVKKIHRIRLPSILSKTLAQLKILIYEGKFLEVNSQLDEIITDIELVNDTELNQQWHDMKIRCSHNLNMLNQLKKLSGTRENLLWILKEIHSDNLIDPSIESEVISRIKNME